MNDQANKRASRVAALLAPVAVAVAAFLTIELSRPDLLIVGNITVDLVDGTTPTGGAVSYAAVVAKALKARSCVVTVAGPEADLDVFDGSRLWVIPANETLTFEHTYTWWGHSRKLRVTANPNITISRAHVPRRCRWARVVLLGPLTLYDLDAASFLHYDGFWDRFLNANQHIGLMAQGFQRDLGSKGEVMPLPAPSKQLLDGLGPGVSLFLSDVETDTWSEQQIQDVTAASGRVIVTLGDKGAVLHENGIISRIPVTQIPKAVDTNGAGDTFATTFMISLMRGDPSPGTTASWAASRAVMQPQTCKPKCAPDLITQGPNGLKPLRDPERAWIAAAPILRRLRVAVAGAGFSDLVKIEWVRQMSELLGFKVGQQQQQAAGGGAGR